MATSDACEPMWPVLEPRLPALIGDDDDDALWRTAVSAIYRDAEYLCRYNPRKRAVRTIIGACSHWLRPHQTRWTADGGFAWPSGYQASTHSRHGVPEHDATLAFTWDPGATEWAPERDPAPRSALTLRVTVPTRTRRHAQAAVHTLWTPGPPPDPNRPMCQFYGFRRIDGAWVLRATSDASLAYERVATALNPSR